MIFDCGFHGGIWSAEGAFVRGFCGLLGGWFLEDVRYANVCRVSEQSTL